MKLRIKTVKKIKCQIYHSITNIAFLMFPIKKKKNKEIWNNRQQNSLPAT